MEFKYTAKNSFDSTAIEVAWYNENTLEMVILFTSGEYYRYFGITQYLWNTFVIASSAGRFYRDYIKGQFLSARLGSVPLFTSDWYQAEETDVSENAEVAKETDVVEDGLTVYWVTVEFDGGRLDVPVRASSLLHAAQIWDDVAKLTGLSEDILSINQDGAEL